MQTTKGGVQHAEPAPSPLYQLWRHPLEKNEAGDLILSPPPNLELEQQTNHKEDEDERQFRYRQRLRKVFKAHIEKRL